MPETVLSFAIDAQLDQLNEDRFARALEAIRNLQIVEQGHPLYGCLPWYYEERTPQDTNSSFFVGLTLIFIERAYGHRIGKRSRELLGDIFPPLATWFSSQLREGKVHYPNKYLGDLVCLWLLAEISEDHEALRRLPPLMEAALDSWTGEGWGWGEHLSQVYSTVMLIEISLLVFLQNQLPENLRERFIHAGQELLRIQEAFGNGPWTPSIRCYAFESFPSQRTFRESIRNWDPEADEAFLRELPFARFMDVSFAHFLFHAGWHRRFGFTGTVPTNRIRCAGDSVASFVEDDGWRLGALSRYPIDPAWDTLQWGLSWQSFPACFAHQSGVWGFAQWCVFWHDGTRRCHPASRKSSGYLDNALVPDGPAFTGSTRGRLKKSSMEVERFMPRWHSVWREASDRWTILLPPGAHWEALLPPPAQGIRIIAPGSRSALEIRLLSPAHKPLVLQEDQTLRISCPLPANDPCTIRWEVALTGIKR